MLSDTLTMELDRYRIGPRIKALRLAKQMGLAQLGQHTGLSTAMLSKIERGQLFPTLPTLMRIALVFGVGLDHFFDQKGPKIAVAKKEERVQLPIEGAEPKSLAYLFESLNYPLTDRKMEAFVAEFPENSVPSEPHQHGTEELVYILAGTLQVTIASKKVKLEEGDAMAFDSSEPHHYQRVGIEACKALVVTVE
ncbi:transcriptional regulator [Nitratireductor aestuarii]|uniref:Transcriptional regulator n=1 Tax=Nitratireductor aestuarii TaxID=1735103 RepID=A0A916RFS7_9HYPH|nr:XRE family transcriptional regulator [Nitratireductor aestuarii]GGA52689.1 transcriptional regulator [Nitratireductor aestuarii]